MKRDILIVAAFDILVLNTGALADQKTFDLMAPIASQMIACEKKLTPEFQRLFTIASLDVPGAIEKILAYKASSSMKILEMDSEKRNKYCTDLEKTVIDTWGK